MSYLLQQLRERDVDKHSTSTKSPLPFPLLFIHLSFLSCPRLNPLSLLFPPFPLVPLTGSACFLLFLLFHSLGVHASSFSSCPTHWECMLPSFPLVPLTGSACFLLFLLSHSLGVHASHQATLHSWRQCNLSSIIKIIM